MKIAMVTLWHGAEFDRMAELVNPAKRRYCRDHGYDFLAYDRLFDGGRHPCWNKVLALQHALPTYDWLFWCDVDTVLWNPHIGLSRFIAAAGDHRLILQSNHEGPNTGVFFLRNHPWSFQLLSHWLAQRQHDSGPLYDQAALVEILREPEVARHVQLYPHREPQGGFHGYYYFRDWDKLLIHFAGWHGKRLAKMADLVKLGEMPAELRIMEREQLGDLLNRLELRGEGAEIGVCRGEHARGLLSAWEGRRLHLVDAWRELPDYVDRVRTDHAQHERNHAETLRAMADFPGRFQVHRGLSVEVAAHIHDASLDFVYLDANHAYDAVAADLRAWFPKVRPGGVFAGHDYIPDDAPEQWGVRRAVDEFAREMGLQVGVTAEEHWPSWYAIRPPRRLRRSTARKAFEPPPAESSARLEHLSRIFVEVPRVSGMGGPFVNDFHVAIEFDAILDLYGCDALIETGTHYGETTEYLARAYPDLPIYSCEISGCYDDARRRLAKYSNVFLRKQSSPEFLKSLPSQNCPLYFLDAHWGDYWPLSDELAAIRHGVVCIHDFDIGHPDFGFDSYGGVSNGPETVARHAPIYGNDPAALYPAATAATNRRGRGYLTIGCDDRLVHLRYLRRLSAG